MTGFELPEAKEAPGTVKVAGYGYVDLRAVRAIEKALMIRTPFHKQTDPTKLPGQIKYHEQCHSSCQYAADIEMQEYTCKVECQYEKHFTKAAQYKPVHGGYPEKQ